MMLPAAFSTAARPLLLLLASSILLSGMPARAQEPPRAPAPADTTLGGRMQGLLESVQDGDAAAIASFFPRRGHWAWVQTRTRPRHKRRVATWRIPGAETARAVGFGGVACESFDVSWGEIGPVEGTLAQWVREGVWRHAGGTRFVPGERSARSPVFVRWRREEGAWVVDAVGDEHQDVLPLLGRPAEIISRDTSLVPQGLAYAAGVDWYTNHQPMRFDGLWYMKYGPLRRISAGEQVHIARVGVRGGVSIYMERGPNGMPMAGVLFVPVAPDEFQPYMGVGREPCR